MTLASREYITSETQSIEPTSVCELDAGIPRYQVPKFHRIAAMSRASTAQTQNAIDSWAIFSRGRSFIIPMATPVPPITTQRKLKNAARITDFFAEREFE